MVFWIIIGIAAVIGAIYGFVIYEQESKRFESKRSILEHAWMTACGLVVGAIIGFFLALIMGWILSETLTGEATYNAPDRPARILDLEDNKETKLDGNGAFILVAGGFSLHEDTERTYSFYQETGEGSYFLHTISADYDTSIRIHFIEGDEVPHVIRKQPIPHWVTPSWIAPIELSPDENTTTTEIWTIYVPRGTITTFNKFKLDNQ